MESFTNKMSNQCYLIVASRNELQSSQKYQNVEFLNFL